MWCGGEATALLEMAPVGYLPKHCQDGAPVAKVPLLEITLLPRRFFSSPRMLGVLCPRVPEALVSGLTSHESTSAFMSLVTMGEVTLPPPALGVIQWNSLPPASLMSSL